MSIRIVLVLILIQNSLCAQKHEVSFDVRYGIATNQLVPNDPFLSKNPADKGSGIYAEQFPYKQVKSIGDWGVDLLYKYRIWKKGKLYLTTGVGFAQSRHYLPLIPNSKRLLENVRIHQERMVFRLGLNKKFHFFNNKVYLDLGIHLTKRFHFNKIKHYSDERKTKYVSYVEYEYDIETIHDIIKDSYDGYDSKNLIKGFHWDYNVTLGFQLKRNMVFRLGVSYTRNYNFYYDYTFTSYHYYPNTDQFINTQGYPGTGTASLFDPKLVSINHYLSLNVGIAYTFDSFKKKDKE